MSARRGRGRPPEIWHTMEFGEKYAHAIFNLRAERRKNGRPISYTAAIRILLQQPGFEYLREYLTPDKPPHDIDYLKKMLIYAAEYWSPWRRLRAEFRKASKKYGALELVERKKN